MGEKVGIVAAGMVTSLGYDVASACAAARAGLTRPSEVACRVQSGNNAPELATGHCVLGLTDGFEGNARLIRLFAGALQDLLSRFQLPERSQVGWFLSLPSAARRALGLERIPSADDRAIFEEKLAKAPAPPSETARAQRILNSALDIAGVSLVPAMLQVSTAGHAGFAEIVETAQQQVAEGELDAAIVGGVDSMVAEPDLHWLNATRRLKCGQQPVGLAPGEGAALLLHASGSAPAIARLHSVQRTLSETSFWQGDAPNGEALAAAMTPLAQVQNADARPPWVLSDHNGEAYRAADWGHALVRLRSAAPVYEDPILWYPAVSFGDTGAASGAIAACMALEAFARSYAPSDKAVISSSSDGPERAALLIES